MKMKNVLMVLLLAVVSQSIMGLGVRIQNNSGVVVYVDPVWSGNPRGLRTLESGTSFSYKTGAHHLSGLWVKVGNACYYHNFEKAGLRGTGDITIFVEKNGKISLAGSTDMLFTDVSRVWMDPARYSGYSMTKRSCE